MNKDLVKGLVKIKLEMAHNLIKHLPEKEAEQVLSLGGIVLDAVNEFVSHPQESVHTTDTESLKNIIID